MSGILVVNPDLDQCKALAESISSRGRHVQSAGSIEEALRLLAREGHEQVISVRNLPEGGCEVELLLPCLPQGRGQVDGDRVERQQLARGHGETVILVEDDAMVRDLVERLLVRQGYAVRVFDSGQRCLDALAVAPEPADLLLLDVVMPGLSGPDLRDELAASGLVLPVLFMSGYAGDALSRWGLAEGRAEFLPKPVIPEDLLQKLSDLLES